MTESDRLRVVVDSRMPEGTWGGVQQVVQGLAYGFSRLRPDIDLTFVTANDEQTWLQPYLGNAGHIVSAPPGIALSRRRQLYERTLQSAPSVARAARAFAPLLGRASVPIPRSNGFLESLNADLIHFTMQQAFLTSTPSLYQPHDLQHVHLPELFPALQRRYRDTTYRAFSAQASIVVMMTSWGRDDLVDSFGLPPERVAVVPGAAVAGLRPGVGPLVAPAGVPDRYLLYPAQTWPHKNHLRLLDAVALLRDRGLDVPVVFTGRQNEHFAVIESRIHERRLERLVTFLGYVDDASLAALFRSAQGLVFPSLFEGWGLPVVEAFAEGVPVAASNATVLPEVTAGAALLFDPLDVQAIADAMARLWNDDALRRDLVDRGRRRAAELSWERTAAIFVALYRKVAGRVLSDSDRALLEPPTLVSGG